MQPGLYLLHKSVGVTSFSLVRTFMAEIAEAGLTRQLPVVHGGTLDPFAEGLLLMGVGQVTRFMDLVHAVPKTYVAELRWGLETDNGDPGGKRVGEGDASGLTPAQLDAALLPFLGWTEQIPPATSAKKLGGEPAYKKAHRGEVVTLPPSRVFVQSARWISHSLPRRSVLALTCRGGFYVRALARDLGRALGCGAHLGTLSRTVIGPWSDPAPGARLGIHGEALMPWCPARRLDDDEQIAIEKGQAIALGTLEAPGWTVPEGFPNPQGPVRALHAGRLMALLEPRGEKLAPFATFRGGI